MEESLDSDQNSHSLMSESDTNGSKGPYLDKQDIGQT